MAKKIDLSVIIPCLNEQDNITELVKRIKKTYRNKKIFGEIVFVNDGSTDQTLKILKGIKQRFSRIVIVNHKVNRGIAQSWRDGLSVSRGEFVCLIDADLQYQPEDIGRLFLELHWSRADLVQGWRSHIGRQRSTRYLLSIVLNSLLNFLFHMNSKDNKSGFILCRYDVLNDILLTKNNYYYFQTFITVAAKAKGYSIKEIETLFDERLTGKSFIPRFPLNIVIKSIIDIVKALKEYRLTYKYDELLHHYSQKKDSIERDLVSNHWLFWLYQITMPIHHWMVNRNAFRYLHDLEKTQWLEKKDLETLQLLKLKKIVNQAYNHVPYYRELFDRCNLKPSNINKLSDIKKIPFLTKEDIKKNLYFNLFSNNYNKNKVLKITTSGSTGEPLVIFVDQDQLNLRFASTLRGMGWAGYRFGDRQIRLWHQTIGMSRTQVTREKIDAFLSRRIFIPAYEMKTNNIYSIIQTIKKYQPKFIDGYAESFNLIANFIHEHKIKGIKVNGMMSSAQTLIKSSRKIIEKEFKTKIYDKYGSREFSGIAYQCQFRQGYHVNDESYLLEIIKNNRLAKPGEMGEVVITDLNNYCIPLIRYRIGDLAKATDNSKVCPCGRQLSKIGSIKGRVQAIIIGQNGELIPGTFFAHLFKDYWYAIRQFQIIQRRNREITLKIVKNDRFSQEIFQIIIDQIKKYLGSQTIIHPTFVDNIPLGKTGKHQHSISRIKFDFQKMS